MDMKVKNNLWHIGLKSRKDILILEILRLLRSNEVKIKQGKNDMKIPKLKLLTLFKII